MVGSGLRTGSGSVQFDRIRIRPKALDPSGSGSGTLLPPAPYLLHPTSLTIPPLKNLVTLPL